MPYPIREDGQYRRVWCKRECPHVVERTEVDAEPWWKSVAALALTFLAGVAMGFASCAYWELL
jgi:hypothetical protein